MGRESPVNRRAPTADSTGFEMARRGEIPGRACYSRAPGWNHSSPAGGRDSEAGERVSRRYSASVIHTTGRPVVKATKSGVSEKIKRRDPFDHGASVTRSAAIRVSNP